MAPINGVIFPESMAHILANPLDICFGSMLAKSATPAPCLVIEGNTVTFNQQVGTDLLTKTHPPTPSNLIAGLDRVEGMLSDTIKVCKCVKRPRRTPSSSSSMPLGLRNATHIASRYMKCKIQIESGPKTPDHGNRMSHLDDPDPSTRTPNTRLTNAVCSRSFDDLSPRLFVARSTWSHLRTTSCFRSPA
jgi:hypothetical protein